MSGSGPRPAAPAPLWRGRALALITIVLVALNLRTAVAALSPIFDEIAVDIPLGSVGIGLLGMLPPLCFAAVGPFAPALHRRFGLEPVVVGALVVMLAGHLLRAAGDSYAVLAMASAVTFAGMGVANVLLPPLVKTYFPDRIGLVTSVYATTMALGATIPPLVAVQVADGAGWRIAVGVWSVLALFALVPLVTLAARARGRRAPVDEPQPRALGGVWRSPLAWSLMLVFGLTGINSYAMFTWLPAVLVDVSGVSAGQAGALLSLYSVTGLPASLVVPVLAVRLKKVSWLVAAGVASYIVGYGGLLLAPGAGIVWLWVTLAGLGALLFPLALVLINLRTRTHEGAVALSSFVQSLGYALSATGPLLVGVLHELTGAWTAPLLLLVASAVGMGFAGIVVARPRMLEDHRPRR
ncbi:MFS transporter [Herbiconiux sp. CPCC 203407]|uniref:MFS transporter n=1 Tax=Herbiconiux oxytropis TaxID=2970915 RepID=A0AA41XDF6_9MICO|nr:MFS transporter [Herbiconiux oxytropis]MCS5720574.1 MFS transporter [Herbiconiux oxytropis]MCS5726147.1 MFS transporter [Herbiconiux oxytropis]